MTDDRRTASLEAQHSNWCRHFAGVLVPECRAGVKVAGVVSVQEDGSKLYPCLRSHGREARCQQADYPSADEARAYAERFVRRATGTAEAWAQAKTAARILGLGKGHGGFGHLPCPVCGEQVKFHVSGTNGHTSGACPSPDCVRWVE